MVFVREKIFMKFVFEFISILLSKIPLAALNALAKFLTWLGVNLLHRRMKVMMRNLDIVYGDRKSVAEKKQIACTSLYHFILTCLEFLAVRDGSLGQGVECSSSGKKILDTALSRGQGVYILCIHIGSWEAMASGMHRLGYKNVVVTKPVAPESLGKLVRRLRKENGMGEIVRHRRGDGYRGIVQALNQNKCLGFVMDQARPNSPMLNFFGMPAKTNTSFAAIYLKRPAPIIPIISTRCSVHRHELRIFPEVKLDFEAAEENSDLINRLSSKLNQEVEKMILACPEQYFWLHNRWKNLS